MRKSRKQSLRSSFHQGPKWLPSLGCTVCIKVRSLPTEIPDLWVDSAADNLPGSDGVEDSRRQYQMFMFMRDPANPTEPDSNHYAFPLPISPVIDATSMKVIRVQRVPTGADSTIEVKPWTPQPPNEYIPEAQESLRKDVKPLHVIQPQGVSFKVTPLGETGQLIEWQKWKFQVGFNYREGMVLYNVRKPPRWTSRPHKQHRLTGLTKNR